MADALKAKVAAAFVEKIESPVYLRPGPPSPAEKLARAGPGSRKFRTGCRAAHGSGEVALGLINLAAMENDRGFPAYRVGPAIRRLYPGWLIGGAIFGAVLVVNVITLVRFGQASALWTPLGLAVVAALVFGYFANERSATVATSDYIETRTLFKTRRTAWHDVQRFEIKGSPKIGQRAFVHTAADGVLRLPHLDTANVESLEAEVSALNRLWEQMRASPV